MFTSQKQSRCSIQNKRKIGWPVFVLVSDKNDYLSLANSRLLEKGATV